ncbi:hypothetical protein [Mobilicoccus massiliensis]|uniref:hypothetical protein n=1 Tax=Mobilicoccus massiliensis TaxID=1522310 RepID=UPI001142D892|nr:hypothetical protein [Mobilicoccus massiliensis]
MILNNGGIMPSRYARPMPWLASEDGVPNGTPMTLGYTHGSGGLFECPECHRTEWAPIDATVQCHNHDDDKEN